MRSKSANLVLVAIVTLSAAFLASSPVLARNDGESAAAITGIAFAALPREAQQTLQIIRRGGPFPHARDGVVFGNYERRLPQRGRGYYREYTVPTPGAKSRGARRIISGGDGEYYYSSDHYRSFQRIRE